MNRRLPSRLIAAIALVTILIGFGAAAAHAEANLLPKSSPTIEGTVQVAPTQLDLFFSQNLTAPPTVVLEQTTPAAGVIALGAVTQGKTKAEWIYPISLALSPGIYVFSLTGSVNTSSRFTVSGTRAATPGAVPTTTPASTSPPRTAARSASSPSSPTVTVLVTTAGGQAPTSGTTAGTSGGSGASGSVKTDAVRATGGPSNGGAKFVGVIGRWANYLGLSALFGGLLLIALAWPEGVQFVLTVRFFRLAWVAALFGAVLTIISMTAIAKGVSVGSAISPSSWFDIKSDGEGLAAIARLLFTAGSAWVAFGPERAVNAASQLPAFAFPFLSIATLGFSRASDAKMVAAGVIAGGLHVLAVAAWLGGLLLLSRVALTAPGEADLVRAVRGFSRIAVPALLVVVVTGAIQVFRLVGGPAKLFSTGWGRLLLLKVFVVAFMAYVATANRHFVRLRLGRAAMLNDRAAFRLRRSIAGEATVGMVVLLLSALMMSLTPAGLSASAATDAGLSPTEIVNYKQSGLDATVGVGPSIAGVENTIRFNVRTPGSTSLIDIEFQFFPVSGTGVPFQIAPPVAELKGGRTYHYDKAVFTQPGTWQVIVMGHTQLSDIPVVTKTFTVAPAKSTTTTTGTTPGTGPVTQPSNSAPTGNT